MHLEQNGRAEITIDEAIIIESLTKHALDDVWNRVRTVSIGWLAKTLSEHPEINSIRPTVHQGLDPEFGYLLKRAKARLFLKERHISSSLTVDFRDDELTEIKGIIETWIPLAQETAANMGAQPEDITILGEADRLPEEWQNRIKGAVFEDALEDLQIGIGITRAIGQYMARRNQ